MPIARAVVCWTTVSLLPLLGACGGEPPSVVGRVSTTIPNQTTPLVRLVEFTTDAPAVATLRLTDGARQWTVAGPDEARTDHAVPIVGLYPARSHTAVIDLRGSSGGDRANAATASFDVPPLPDDFPPMETRVSTPDRMEPGWTMFTVLKWTDTGQDLSRGLLVAVDPSGEVVWYFRPPFGISDCDLTARNTVLCQGWRHVVEVDMLGNRLATWRSVGLSTGHGVANGIDPPETVPVQTDMFHHEIIERPSGDFFVLATELRQYDDYPTDERQPRVGRETGNVVGDVIVQFDRAGATSREWKLFDILDPYRIGYDGLRGYYDQDYAPVGPTRDWSHANALFHDTRDDSFVVSVRNQDAIIKIGRESGELIWILGDPAGWGERWQPYLLQPEGDLLWPYHQHGSKITPHGTLLLFDNGNFKAIPPARGIDASDNYSRAVEYAIDEAAMTVRQVWAYGGPDDRFFATFLGDADWMHDTGNVLVTDGGRVVDEDGVPTQAVPIGRKFGRIVEVTHTDPAETVFELFVDTGEFPGWSIYRAQRVAPLHVE